MITPLKNYEGLCVCGRVYFEKNIIESNHVLRQTTKGLILFKYTKLK